MRLQVSKTRASQPTLNSRLYLSTNQFRMMLSLELASLSSEGSTPVTVCKEETSSDTQQPSYVVRSVVVWRTLFHTCSGSSVNSMVFERLQGASTDKDVYPLRDCESKYFFDKSQAREKKQTKLFTFATWAFSVVVHDDSRVFRLHSRQNCMFILCCCHYEIV